MWILSFQLGPLEDNTSPQANDFLYFFNDGERVERVIYLFLFLCFFLFLSILIE